MLLQGLAGVGRSALVLAGRADLLPPVRRRATLAE
jgi:hypothetical protein